MFKALKASILLSIIFFTTIHSSVYYGIFKVFQNYYIEQFCVNTNKPELECNAKCYYTKKTIEIANLSKSNNFSLEIKFFNFYFKQKVSNIWFFINNLYNNIFSHKNSYKSNFYKETFIPPRIVVN